MTKIFGFLLLATVAFVSCTDKSVDPEYAITIMNPTAVDKAMDEAMHIHVNFDSGTESTIHHVNVKITNKADNTEVFNMPSDAHVHEGSGHYEFHADFDILAANGFTADTDYILEARVWGHEAGLAEVSTQVEFRVNP